MSSLNLVFLYGRLKADPVVFEAQGKSKTAKFTLVTSEKWRDKNNNLREKIEFHNIKAIGKKADICINHLKKGNRVFVEGSISCSNSINCIIVSKINLLDYNEKADDNEKPNTTKD